MTIGYALVRLADNTIMSTWNAVPASFRVPGTRDDVLAPAIGWRNDAHALMEMREATVEFDPDTQVRDGATMRVEDGIVIATPVYRDRSAIERIVAIEAASRPSDRFLREAILTLAEFAAASGQPLADTPPLRKLREAEARIRAIRDV